MTGERWHGTTGGYTNHGCRCPDCRAAWREYHREYMARSGQNEAHAARENDRYYAFRRGEYVPPRVAAGGSWYGKPRRTKETA